MQWFVGTAHGRQQARMLGQRMQGWQASEGSKEIRQCASADEQHYQNYSL